MNENTKNKEYLLITNINYIKSFLKMFPFPFVITFVWFYLENNKLEIFLQSASIYIPLILMWIFISSLLTFIGIYAIYETGSEKIRITRTKLLIIKYKEEIDFNEITKIEFYDEIDQGYRSSRIIFYINIYLNEERVNCRINKNEYYIFQQILREYFPNIQTIVLENPRTKFDDLEKVLPKLIKKYKKQNNWIIK